MAQRLSRAKAKIREAGIPYEVPGRERLAERLAGVLAVAYLVFTEGYAPSVGDATTRPLVPRLSVLCGCSTSCCPASPNSRSSRTDAPECGATWRAQRRCR